MPRQMTKAEKQRFHASFPNLDVNLAVVTGGISTVYKCISWTVGFTASVSPIAGSGPEAPLEGVMRENTARGYLSAVQRRVLKEQRAIIREAIQRMFQQRFAAWSKTWFSGGLAISSDPHTRRVGKEYDALISMGPVILPLVVEKLAEPDNFMALQLYDAIQPDHKLRVQYGPEDERILEGEQGRARRTVQAWCTNQ